jgi:circadian clock protein KaiC
MWQSNCRVTRTSQGSGGEHRGRWHAWGNIDQGVTLAEAYTAGGEVPMVTLRWEKERAGAAERELRRAEAEHKRCELEASEAEIVSRLEVLKHELEAKRAELHLLQVQQEAQEERWESQQKGLGALRGVDKEAGNDPSKHG